MMPIFGSLFGGGKSKTDPASVYGPQSDFLSQYFPQLSTYMEQGLQDPSSIIPGFTQNELQGQQAALQAAQGFAPAQQAAMSGLQNLFGAGQAMNPMITGAVEAATAPLFQQFQNVVTPSIRRAAGGMGRSGDTKAAQLAASDLFRQAGDISKSIALPAYQSGLQAIQGGISALPSLFQNMMAPSEIQRQVGAEERAMQMQQSPLSILEMFKNLSGSPIVLSGGGREKTAKGGAADLVGMGMAAASLFSDRRLKRNIKKIGQLENGLGWYKFDYIWGESSEGVMADEVEKVIPHAVSIHPSGYKMVNYGELQ
jgi:hypothetical protein